MWLRNHNYNIAGLSAMKLPKIRSTDMQE